MAGDDGGGLDAQRHALEAVAAAGPDAAAYAIYGGADCGGYRDIGDAAAVVHALKSTHPAGRRNLAAALDAIADAPTSDTTTAPQKVVVVVGGPNQCLAALCAKASMLKRERPDLTVDLLGLGLSDDAARRLACVAANTGGRLLRVEAGGIATALTQLARQSTDVLAKLPAPRKRPVVEANGASSVTPATVAPNPEWAMSGPELSLPRGLRLTAALTETSAVLEGGVRFDVLRRDADGVLRLAARTYRTGAPLFELPPGRYVARVVAGAASRDAAITIPKDGILARRIVLAAGQVEMTAAVSGRPIASAVARFRLQRLDSPAPEVMHEGAGSALLTVPAGRYRAIAEIDGARVQQDIVVTPGALVAAKLDLAVGFLRVDGAPGAGAPVRVLRFGREVARSGERRPLFRLPPGAYRVSGPTGTIRATVVDGGVTRVDLARPDTPASPPLTARTVARKLVAER